MGKRTFNWAELKPEVKQVWQLSLPAILTQITTIAMQYIDSAMVVLWRLPLLLPSVWSLP